MSEKRGTNKSASEMCSAQPLLFYPICGKDVRIDTNGKIARRISRSAGWGYCFSNRPVKVGERVCLKLNKISDSWSGIKFGFSSLDPTTFGDALPPLLSPNLTGKPIFYGDFFNGCCAVQGLVVHYYYNSNGNVHFGINGEEEVFFSGVDKKSPLWAVIDVYGNSTAIEFLDPQSRNGITVSSSVSRQSHNATVPSSLRSYASPPPLSQVIHFACRPLPRPQIQTTTRAKKAQSPHQPAGIPHKCTICFEKSIDSVLYKCGHVCMCYQCAMEQWRGRGGGQCPICRAPIRDVIRTYHS